MIRWATAAVLSGQALRGIVAELNARGALTVNDKRWSTTTLRLILLRERNAGRRVYQGQVVGRGDWQPVLDEDTHTRVLALLTDPGHVVVDTAVMRSSRARCGNPACPTKPVIEGEDDRTPYDQRQPCPVCQSRARLFARAVTDSVAAVDLVATSTLSAGGPTAGVVALSAKGILGATGEVSTPAGKLTLLGLPVTHQLIVLFADLSDDPDAACVIEVQTSAGELLVSGVGETAADALASLFEHMLPPSSSEYIDPNDGMP